MDFLHLATHVSSSALTPALSQDCTRLIRTVSLFNNHTSCSEFQVQA